MSDIVPIRSRAVGAARHPSARLLLLAAALHLALPSGAHAQGFFRRIRDTARQKAAAAAARAAGAAVQKSGEVADTALSLGVTGADSASGRAAGAAGSVVGRVQGLLPGALGGRAGSPAIPTASQGMPPIPLHGVVFVGAADTLDTASIAYLRQLAPRLREMGERFAIVATVSPSGDTKRDQARADRRAALVKSAFVASGAAPAALATLGRVEPLGPAAPVGGVTLVKQS